MEVVDGVGGEPSGDDGVAGVLSGRSSSVSSPTQHRNAPFAASLAHMPPDTQPTNGVLATSHDDVDHLSMGTNFTLSDANFYVLFVVVL